MARAIRHRGPDGFGLYLDRGAGLVSARLAIFDLEHGWQPLVGAATDSVLVYNGETYNHPELRASLELEGAQFRTHSDTEVVHALLERHGTEALSRLNGQFAVAWWQPQLRRLTLVRDRFGVRPLFYAISGDGSISFGSEAKALFASGEVMPSLDLAGLDQVFTLWGSQAPRTVFAGIRQLEPGAVLVWERGTVIEHRRWWRPGPEHAVDSGPDLGELMRDSVRLRLRADVPVGAYLSGGLDSSLISALAQVEKHGELRTFSVAFEDPLYDERSQQQMVAQALGTRHHVVEVAGPDIAAAFPDVVRHTETPLVRTAPVPMYLLAREVRDHDLTVVATGEGADELFWGYDLFKEVAIRDLHRRDPDRAVELLGKLYPHLGSTARRGPGWSRFLLETGAEDEVLSSHMTRVAATGAVRSFYRDEVAAQLSVEDALAEIRAELPEGFTGWDRLDRATWLEVTTLLEPYLLSAQGDRVAMAHGVEGRYPFLDHRVYDHSVALPAERKLTYEHDKIALRRLAEELLPDQIVSRGKQPYRAPEVAPFFGPDAPGWVEEALSPAAIESVGVWDSARAEGLLRRCRAGRATGVREGMALIGMLSTQIWYDEFVAGEGSYPAETAEPKIRIDRTEELSMSDIS